MLHRLPLRPTGLLLGALFLFVAWVPTPVHAQTWELMWADEFDVDGAPDPASWTYDLGDGCPNLCGWGNNESQFYTDAPENARVEDGRLVITARLEDEGGRSYTSARLVTRGLVDFTYGRVVASIKMPSGAGTWPAFWMLYTQARYGNGSWPDNGEIDIMEYVGSDPDRTLATLHFSDRFGGNGVGIGRSFPDLETSFNEYEVRWTPSRITFYFNGSPLLFYDNPLFNPRALPRGWQAWPFDQPFHLLLNVAVGGTLGGDIDDRIFPTQMEVDYVRIYQDASARPSVTLTESSVDANGQVTLAAEASDPSGEAPTVSFYQGDGLLASVEAPPYTFTLPDAADGCYQIRARATDADGWTQQTAPVDLQVGATCPARTPYLMAPHPVPGRIEAEYYDIGGASDFDAENNGGAARLDEAVDLSYGDDGGTVVVIDNIVRRESVSYTVQVPETGLYRMNARVASAISSGRLRVQADGETLGTLTFEPTGDDEAWDTASLSGLPLEAGTRTLTLRFESAGFRLNWFALVAEATTRAEADPDLPQTVQLGASYPNPFTTAATVPFTLETPGHVTLEVFDVTGRRVARLLDRTLPAGPHTATFEAAEQPDGTYFYILTTPAGRMLRAMTLVR